MAPRPRGKNNCLEHVKLHEVQAIKSMQSQVSELQKELAILRKENGTLQALTNRQRHEITSMKDIQILTDDSRTEVVQLMQKIEEREKLLHEISTKSSQIIIKQVHVENQMNKLKPLVENKLLHAMDVELTRQRIREIQNEISEKENVVQELQIELQQRQKHHAGKYKKMYHIFKAVAKEAEALQTSNRHLSAMLRLNDMELSSQSLHGKSAVRLPALPMPGKKLAIQWTQGDNERISKWLQALNI